MIEHIKKYAPEYVLGVGALVWVIVMSGLATAQYHLFLYDALDLGIYTQVLWNTVHGHLFSYTFNNYSYLADHREWILLALAPLFALVAHPLTLVYIQICALAMSVVPLRGLFLFVHGESRTSRWVAACAAVLVLMHPAIQNMALYEFHALIFVIPASVFLWLAYEQRSWRRVIVWSVVLLCIREDVGFLLSMVGVLMCWRARTRRERVYGAVLAVSALCVAVVMIILGGVWFPAGSEKFLVFYPQLGRSVTEVLNTLVFHPYVALSPLWSYDHLWILLVCVTSVAGLCLLAPAYLLPALPQFLLIALIPKNMLASALNTHYAAPIIVWVCIAAIYGSKLLLRLRNRRVLWMVALAMLIVMSMHSLILNGALFSISRMIVGAPVAHTERVWEELQRIDTDDRVLSSHTFMTPLSLREYSYPMLQVFTGTNHYEDTPYQLPDRVDWVVWSPRDMVEMTLNFPFDRVSSGWDRVHEIIIRNDLHKVVETMDVVMYGKDATVVDMPLQTHGYDRYDARVENVTISDCAAEYDDGSAMTCMMQADGWDSAGDVHGVVQWYDAQGHELAHQWVTFLNSDLQPSHQWSEEERVAITIPLRAVAQATAIRLTAVFVTQQETKIFLSRHAVDLRTLSYITLDLTPIIFGELEK